MKRVLLALLGISLAAPQAAAVPHNTDRASDPSPETEQVGVLKGIILRDEVGGTGVDKVEVTADGANRTTTRNRGKLTLKSPGKKPGEIVRLVCS